MSYYIRVFSIFVLSALSAACGRQGRDNDPAFAVDNVRDTLYHYLAREANQTYGAKAIDPDRLSTHSRPSAAVPRLRLHFGEYQTRERLHLLLGIMAGDRNGRIRIIRNEHDYFGLVEGWEPNTATEAIAACKEAISASIQWRKPGGPSFFAAGDSTHPAFLADEWATIARHASHPETRRLEHAWKVDVWAFQSTRPRGAVRFECLAPRGGATPWQLMSTDSVVFPEIPN